MRTILSLISLVNLATGALSAAPASPAPLRPHAPFGTQRGDAAPARRRLLPAADGGGYEHMHDKFDFTGPVAGLGFVEHAHDVVFFNTTAFLDDFAPHFASDLRCDSAAASGGGAGASRGSGAPPLLPGEEHAARRRRAYTLRFALRGEGAAAFPTRFASAAHLVVGLAALGRSEPACAALLGAPGAPPAYRVVAADALGGGGGGGNADLPLAVTLRLEPAALLDVFAACSIRHHADPDVGRALRRRNETLGRHYPEARGLLTMSLFQRGMNWQGGAADQGGGVVEPQLPLLRAPGLSADCVNCYAYITSSVTVELTFCAWAWVDVWWVGWVGSTVGVCTSEDYAQRGRGFHLSLAAFHEAGAELSVGLSATFDANGNALSGHRAALLPPWTPLSYNFYISGLTLTLNATLGLDAKTSLSGALSGSASLGSVRYGGSIKTGFSFDSRSGLSPINVLTFTEQRTLPSLVLAFSTASYHVELIPYVAMRFISVSVEAAIPLRLQADFNYVAPDAVLCDIPRCTVGSTGALPVYATYQMRLQISLKELRFRHLTSIMPSLFNSVINMLVSDFVVFPMQLLVDAPITARFKLLSLCAPGYVSLGGGGRLLDGADNRSHMQLGPVGLPTPLSLLIPSPSLPALTGLFSAPHKGSNVNVTEQILPVRNARRLASLAVSVSPSSLGPGDTMTISWSSSRARWPVKFEVYTEGIISNYRGDTWQQDGDSGTFTKPLQLFNGYWSGDPFGGSYGIHAWSSYWDCNDSCSCKRQNCYDCFCAWGYCASTCCDCIEYNCCTQKCGLFGADCQRPLPSQPRAQHSLAFKHPIRNSLNFFIFIKNTIDIAHPNANPNPVGNFHQHSHRHALPYLNFIRNPLKDAISNGYWHGHGLRHAQHHSNPLRNQHPDRHGHGHALSYRQHHVHPQRHGLSIKDGHRDGERDGHAHHYALGNPLAVGHGDENWNAVYVGHALIDIIRIGNAVIDYNAHCDDHAHWHGHALAHKHAIAHHHFFRHALAIRHRKRHALCIEDLQRLAHHLKHVHPDAFPHRF
jgi:hypothetical protein